MARCKNGMFRNIGYTKVRDDKIARKLTNHPNLSAKTCLLQVILCKNGMFRNFRYTNGLRAGKITCQPANPSKSACKNLPSTGNFACCGRVWYFKLKPSAGCSWIWYLEKSVNSLFSLFTFLILTIKIALKNLIINIFKLRFLIPELISP